MRIQAPFDANSAVPQPQPVCDPYWMGVTPHEPLPNIESSLMSSPPYVEHIRSIDKAINKVSNSPGTVAPSRFPSRPGTLLAIEHGSEGVQMANNRQSKSFSMQHLAMTAY